MMPQDQTQTKPTHLRYVYGTLKKEFDPRPLGNVLNLHTKHDL